MRPEDMTLEEHLLSLVDGDNPELLREELDRLRPEDIAEAIGRAHV